MDISKNLYDLRKRAGLSQEELADKIGVSRQAISKWERNEALPDTENLIALSELYSVTLDEIIKGIKKSDNDPESEPANKKSSEENNEDKKYTNINFKDGIHIDDGDSHVHIDLSGIHVDDGKDHVHISGNGVHVTSDGKVKINKKKGFKYKKEQKSRVVKAFKSFPYPILATVLYLIFGFCGICGGWGAGWVIFLTIPIYYSLVDAIYYRSPAKFCYPIFMTVIYLFLGMAYSLWHPYWILFLTIPLYYGLVGMFRKASDDGAVSEIEFVDDDDDEEDDNDDE